MTTFKHLQPYKQYNFPYLKPKKLVEIPNIYHHL